MSELSSPKFESEKVVLHHESVGVIISCLDLGTFMFQLNGKEHPDPRCQGKYQLWGGRIEPVDNGDPYLALKRELYEEWRAHDVADEVLSVITSEQRPKSFVLKSNGGTDHPYHYRLHTFLALVESSAYMDWLVRLNETGYNEGTLSVLERKTVQDYIYSKDESRFLGSLSSVIDYYLKHEELLRYA